MDQAINGYKVQTDDKEQKVLSAIVCVHFAGWHVERLKLSTKSDSGKNSSFLSFLRNNVTVYLTLYKTERKNGGP